jgi:hypothetical protein
VPNSGPLVNRAAPSPGACSTRARASPDGSTTRVSQQRRLATARPARGSRRSLMAAGSAMPPCGSPVGPTVANCQREKPAMSSLGMKVPRIACLL